MLQLSPPELALLRRLRTRFLESDPRGGDYWRSEEELALYDRTFGERIGWKWDAVLGELTARGWRPRSGRVIDWGCGSGIAGRRVLAQWPGASLTLHDRSPLAMRHAAALSPGAEVAPDLTPAMVADALLLVSHVINELPPRELARLRELARVAREIIWVEPGTHAESRRLGAEVREPLLAEGFSAVAPCTHSRACGMLSARNERHWCHSFARPPSAAFQDAGWATFAKELGIDLRALPYSFLVLHRAPAVEKGWARLIGHPREYKGHLKLLSSAAEGVRELTLQKRDAPVLYREVRDGEALPLYRWEVQQERIVSGEAVGESDE